VRPSRPRFSALVFCNLALLALPFLPGCSQSALDSTADSGSQDGADQGAADPGLDGGADLGADPGTDLAAPDVEVPGDDGEQTPEGWVKIPAGSFTMGTPGGEPCRYAEEDLHQVTLSHAFEIMTTEVTQRAYEGLMGINPSGFPACGQDCPVEQVKWIHAVQYCNKLSEQSALAPCYECVTDAEQVTTCTPAAAYAGQKIYDCPGYRLPTEAEWEYAYRAGTAGAYYASGSGPASCGTCLSDPSADGIAWHCGNSGVLYTPCQDLSEYGGASCAGAHPVGLKAPNAWGLYDLAGNVWEWCHDWYQERLGTDPVTDPWGAETGTFKMVRGGSWDNSASSARAGMRNSFTPYFNYPRLGFRVVRSR
jgi:formylglycine-generating enzyme required for sulfatase activity